MSTYLGYQYVKTGKVISLGSQTSGSGSDLIKTVSCEKIAIECVIASISTNVVLRMEGSLDGSNWFNLDESGVDTTITVDGRYLFISDDISVIGFVRMYWVSTSGGTPTITCNARVA